MNDSGYDSPLVSPRKLKQTPRKPSHKPVIATLVVSLLVILGTLNNLTRHQSLSTTPLDFTLPKSYSGLNFALKNNLKFTGEKGIYAYVFYASSPEYACSALVNIHRLKALGVDDSIDFVVIYPKGTLEAVVLNRIEKLGAVPLQVEDMPRAQGHNGYYHYANVKLRVFQLYQYQRIIFLDSDTIILKSLDHLFLLPRGIGLAAPRVYWIKDQEFTSTMLVIEPSEELWQKIDKELHPVKPDHFDMDILNDALGRDCLILPNIYGLLNSHWENKNDLNMGNLDVLKEKAYLAHFTAVGKPWSHDWKAVGGLRPQHHPFFVELWKMWWDAREEVGCFNDPADAKVTTPVKLSSPPASAPVSVPISVNDVQRAHPKHD
jgi:alpha-N-acetylglucosamine transferase